MAGLISIFLSLIGILVAVYAIYSVQNMSKSNSGGGEDYSDEISWLRQKLDEIYNRLNQMQQNYNILQASIKQNQNMPVGGNVNNILNNNGNQVNNTVANNSQAVIGNNNQEVQNQESQVLENKAEENQQNNLHSSLQSLLNTAIKEYNGIAGSTPENGDKLKHEKNRIKAAENVIAACNEVCQKVVSEELSRETFNSMYKSSLEQVINSDDLKRIYYNLKYKYPYIDGVLL